MRSTLAITVRNNWDLFQIDVDNAFLIPLGFSKQGEKEGCKLIKSLYGLKQAVQLWNTKLCEALLIGGFVQSKFDYSLFT